jgi:death-on-curing protein
VKNHALIDGNKRAAWILTCSFLWINGREPHFSDDEAYGLVVEIAVKSMELVVIALRLNIE